MRSLVEHAPGDFLGFYSGRVVTESAYEAWNARDARVESLGFEIPGTDHVVVRISDADIIGFINEVPPNQVSNVVALGLVLDRGNAIGYFAGRSISAGEELLVHYGDEYEREYPVGDECDTPERLQQCHEVVNVLRTETRFLAPRTA